MNLYKVKIRIKYLLTTRQVFFRMQDRKQLTDQKNKINLVKKKAPK